VKTVKNTTFYFLLLICLLALLGCSQKTDENKSVSEVKAEVEKMDTNQLRSMAISYKEALMAQKGEVRKLIAKLKSLPATEIMDTEAKEIQAELENISKSMSALNEKFNIYYNKLAEKGGDTSSL